MYDLWYVEVELVLISIDRTALMCCMSIHLGLGKRKHFINIVYSEGQIHTFFRLEYNLKIEEKKKWTQGKNAKALVRAKGSQAWLYNMYMRKKMFNEKIINQIWFTSTCASGHCRIDYASVGRGSRNSSTAHGIEFRLGSEGGSRPFNESSSFHCFPIIHTFRQYCNFFQGNEQ